APLKNLQTLWLDWTKITDDGLKELASLKYLEELRLDGTAVTAAGLRQLSGLKQLDRIEAQKTQITQAALNDLRTALPQVRVNTQKARGDGAAEEEEGPRAFWWLFAVMGALAAATLVGWVVVKRKSLVEAGIVAGALALLVLIGYYLTQGATPAAPPPANAAPPRELTLRGHTGPLRSLCFTPDGRRLVS